MSANKRVLPNFATEDEEAEWWYANREKISDDFEEAARNGELKILTKEMLRERLAAKPITIRLAEADIELARKQAERKGLPYQTYIRSLLHEALAGVEEKRA